MPLIFSSLDKIETISTAMELRGFGSKKNRTWYSERKFKVSDYITVIIMVVISGNLSFTEKISSSQFLKFFCVQTKQSII